MNQQSKILLLNPAIANLTGVNESIVLQQLYYWHQKYSFQKWIYNSYEDWQKQFSFWSIRTIRRIFTSLEKQGFIASKRSKTCKFYRLCEDTIKKFFQNQDSPPCPSRVSKMATPIYKEEAKNNHKISSYEKKKQKKLLKKEKREIEITEYDQNLVETMIDKWNEIFEYSLKPIKAYITQDISTKLTRLYQDIFHSDMNQWISYAKKVNSSQFLMGEKETEKGFKAVFSWLIQEDVVNSILSDAYGVGDRILDAENLEKNIKAQEMQIKTKMNDKISQYLEQKINSDKEEKAFKDYLMQRKYEEDNDKYHVKEHMEKIGKYYMYGGYITPSHIYYSGNEGYKKRIYHSYLMVKYLGADEISLDKQMREALDQEQNKAKLFQNMKEIRSRIQEWDICVDGTACKLPIFSENSQDVALLSASS